VSAENVDLIMRGYAHYAETGDIFAPAFHENIEWHTASDLPDSDTYRGIEAVGAFIKGWPTAFEDFGADIQEVVDEGDYVVVSMTLRGRLRDSGEEVAMPEIHVFKLHEGRAIEVREYRTKEAALEAIAAAAAPQSRP
jgi:ketosteroid isomerase-like protein